MRDHPPSWAESTLRVFLSPDAFPSVSGDLLEQYRDSILPARGAGRADAWYLRQVMGFVLRKTWPWAALFAGAFVGRGILDVLVPVADFHTRSQASTAIAAGLLLGVGLQTAWRSGSFFAGAAAGLATTGAAGILSIGANAVLLAMWHDQQTMSAIAASGGVEEAFTLPIMLVVPGVVLGAIGGFAGAGVRRVSQ